MSSSDIVLLPFVWSFWVFSLRGPRRTIQARKAIRDWDEKHLNGLDGVRRVFKVADGAILYKDVPLGGRQ